MASSKSHMNRKPAPKAKQLAGPVDISSLRPGLKVIAELSRQFKSGSKPSVSAMLAATPGTPSLREAEPTKGCALASSSSFEQAAHYFVPGAHVAEKKIEERVVGGDGSAEVFAALAGARRLRFQVEGREWAAVDGCNLDELIAGRIVVISSFSAADSLSLEVNPIRSAASSRGRRAESRAHFKIAGFIFLAFAIQAAPHAGWRRLRTFPMMAWPPQSHVHMLDADDLRATFLRRTVLRPGLRRHASYAYWSHVAVTAAVVAG